MTPKGAREAGRDNLPSRVPYIPFPIDGENAGFVRHVRRCSIERRGPLQAPVVRYWTTSSLPILLWRPRSRPTSAGASPDGESDATFLIETIMRQWNSRQTTSADIFLYRIHDENVFLMANGPLFVPKTWQYSSSAQNGLQSRSQRLRLAEAATVEQDLAIGALNQNLPCLSLHRSCNWGAKGWGTWLLAPFSFSVPSAKGLIRSAVATANPSPV